MTSIGLLSLALATAGPIPESALRFEVRVDPALIDHPESGRLLVILGQPDGPEPRLDAGRTGLDAPPILGRDVARLSADEPIFLGGDAAIFPIARLADLPAGDYRAQAIFHSNKDLNVLNAPGDLVGPAVLVHLDPARGGSVALGLSRRLPPEEMPKDSESIQYIKLQSPLLSAFHGRPIDLRAGVVLPRGFDREPDRRYPLRVHIGGFGERFTTIGRRRAADDAPPMILLRLDGAGPLGDPYQVNSANHGPFGDAITRELIPFVERKYRGIGAPFARFLDGGSTGGWVALALQVFYPDFFNGAWAACPDGVDFRSFQLVNIYKDENAYINSHGFERPAARDTNGEVRYTMRHECALENVLGLGDSWAMSGGQWGSWNATYGPRGPDGRPVPLWDPKSGLIDRSVVEHWKKYDLRMILERDWATLGPKLRGKIHIWIGDADDFFLNNAVHRLDEFLRRADPPADASIVFRPGAGHCWMGISERVLMEQMTAAARAGAR